jgi:hypothetical protein
VLASDPTPGSFASSEAGAFLSLPGNHRWAWRRPFASAGLPSRWWKGVEIRKIGGDEPLVTAIEVFSPTNKTDPRGRRAYPNKREAYYDASVNVVEIDLLCAGEDLIDIDLEYIPLDMASPYKACVRSAGATTFGSEDELYPISLRERLPKIAIPLRPTDADIPLDLQALIDQAYELGRYAARLDYSKPLRPPLSPGDAAWAADCIRSRQS